MYFTARFRRALAILLSLSLALSMTISAAPDAAAQDEEVPLVTGTVRAGESPLADVTIVNTVESAVTNSEGEFTIVAIDGPDDVSVDAVQGLTSPEFSLIGAIDFSDDPLVIELPEIVNVEFTVEGGFYPDCTYDEAIVDGCFEDEICVPELAAQGLCGEVYLEIRSEINGVELTGFWSSVGETIDNTITLPLFDVPNVTISAFSIDASVTDFEWNGTASQTLTLFGPPVTDWYLDADLDSFGDEFGTAVQSAFPPGDGYVPDNSDCDDTNPDINPTAFDVPGNEIDEDCDGLDAFVEQITGSVTAGGLPLAGVLIDSPDLGIFEAQTNSDGEFVFDRPNTVQAEVFVSSPDITADIPFFNALITVDNLDIANAVELRLPAIERVDVIVNDPDRPGYLDVEGEYTVRVLDNLTGADIVNGSWATSGDTADGMTTIALFVGPVFIAARNMLDEAVLGATFWDGGNPVNIAVQAPPYLWYFDGDGDFFGDENSEPVAGEVPPGPNYSENNLDCNDADPAINPLAEDIPENAIDENCDGVDSGPALDLRFDIVRENGEVCPPDFASATPGIGEPLFIDEFEEVTFCFSIINNGSSTITNVTLGSDSFGASGPYLVPDLGPGEQLTLAVDGFTDPSEFEIQATATALGGNVLLSATDSAAVDSVPLPFPVELAIGDFVITNADDVLEVPVTLSPGDEPIAALSFTVTYDPAVITPVLSTNINDGIIGSPACTGFGGCGPVNPDGMVNVIVIRELTETTDIVMIPFRAVANGTSSLEISNVEVIADTTEPIDDVFWIDGSVLVDLPPPGPMCGGLPVTIDMRTGASGIGTQGNDVIMGTQGVDLIKGRGGNDVICALGGADEVLAGTGDDRVFGGGGDDIIKGGSGADDLRGGAGADVLFGHRGNDKLFGGTDNDDLRGNAGDDELRGGPGDDVMRGGSGDDDLRGHAGSDVLWGNADNDSLYGNLDDDLLRGGSGDDSHVGGSAFDTCIDRSGTNSFTTCEADRVAAPA